jgi:hypothetical protein
MRHRNPLLLGVLALIVVAGPVLATWIVHTAPLSADVTTRSNKTECIAFKVCVGVASGAIEPLDNLPTYREFCPGGCVPDESTIPENNENCVKDKPATSLLHDEQQVEYGVAANCQEI